MGVIRQGLDTVSRGDEKTFASHFRDHCIVTSDKAALFNPEEIAKVRMHDLHAGIIYKDNEPLDFQLHVFGEMVVATLRIELDRDWEGQKLFKTSHFTYVFAPRGERWLPVAYHEITSPNAQRVAVKVNPILFDACAGEY